MILHPCIEQLYALIPFASWESHVFSVIGLSRNAPIIYRVRRYSNDKYCEGGWKMNEWQFCIFRQIPAVMRNEMEMGNMSCDCPNAIGSDLPENGDNCLFEVKWCVYRCMTCLVSSISSVYTISDHLCSLHFSLLTMTHYFRESLSVVILSLVVNFLSECTEKGSFGWCV